MASAAAPTHDAWFVSVEGKSYGPYTEEQMAAFIAEGRVGASTPVMRSGGRWSMAGEHKDIAWIFGKQRPAHLPPEATAEPTPVPAPAPIIAPAPQPVAVEAPAPVPALAAPADAAALDEAPLAKILIVADLRSGSTMAFEAAVARLGKSYRMNQFVWLLHAQLPIAQIRKELLPHLGRNDPLFIADTTHGRAAWLNFGPGAEATIKALWRGL